MLKINFIELFISLSGPCFPSPCLNDGTCIRDGNNFTCNCPAAFSGPICTELIDPCAQNLCINGICTNTEDMTDYICECDMDYTGRNCDMTIDDCVVNNVDCNNGICVNDDGGGYSCYCLPGYTGDLCETDIDNFCSTSQAIVCANGGTCMEGEGPLTFCECPIGFSGDNCLDDLPFCQSTICQNGTTCVEGVGTITICLCATGFTGSDCGTPIQSGACQSHSDCPGNEFCQVSCLADSYPSHTSLLSEPARLTGVSFVSVPSGNIPSIPQDLTLFIVFRQEPGNRGYVFFYGTSADSRNLGVFLDSTSTSPGIYLYYTSSSGVTRAIRLLTPEAGDNSTHTLAITIATSINPGSARFFLDGSLLENPRGLVAPDLSFNVNRCNHSPSPSSNPRPSSYS